MEGVGEPLGVSVPTGGEIEGLCGEGVRVMRGVGVRRFVPEMDTVMV